MMLAAAETPAAPAPAPGLPAEIASALKGMTRLMGGRPSSHAIDAALAAKGAATYATRRVAFGAALYMWRQQIAAEQLHDYTIPSLYDLAVDPRDGALVRGAGGLCYTPHAWRQLVQLFRASGSAIPSETIAADVWHAPLTRHLAFQDVKRASKRPQGEEAVLRTFIHEHNGKKYRTLRAVVSGRHSLTHTDDLAVAKVLETLPEVPSEGRVTRAWDRTWGSFALDAGDPDVRYAFAFSNSETGCGSLSFSGAILLRALDVEIVRPDGSAIENAVTIASDSATTRRRHTLPRKAGKAELSEEQRGNVAADRIAADIETALAGARALRDAWERAKKHVDTLLVPLAQMTEVTDGAVEVLGDALLELGAVPSAALRGGDTLKTFARRVAQVMADDARLRALPHGSRAHLAATLAVLASSMETWEAARETQQLAGQILARC